MEDFLYQLTNVDTYTISVTVALLLFVFWFLYEVVGSGILALAFTPFLLAGALAANYLIRFAVVQTPYDKDTNVILASSVGILVSLTMAIGAVWIVSVMRDRRARNKRILRPGE